MARDPGELLGLLFQHSPIPQFVSRSDGAIVVANPAYAELVGITPEAAVGTVPADVTHPDDVERLLRAGLRLLRGQDDLLEVELRVVRADGEVRWCVASSRLAHQPGQEPLLVSFLLDVTSRKQAEAELAVSQETANRLASIADSTSDMLGVVDARGWVVYANKAARVAHGLPDDPHLRVHSSALYTEASVQVFRDQVLPTLLEGHSWSGELDMVRADGTEMPVWQSIAAELDADGALRQFSAVGRDITEQKRLEAQLAHQATHDPLTDLPNRSFLLAQLDRALGAAAPGAGSVALLFIDVDRLKAVNDRHGHDAGDDLLVEVAQRLAGAVPADTVVARLGGDEFVVLARDLADEDEASALARRILGAVGGRPMVVRGREIDLTASIGIAISSPGRGDHSEGLLREADAAMYRAKARGRARFELFDEGMRHRVAHRQGVVDELRSAIARGELVLHHQPIVDLHTGLVTAVESLVRWQHPERGLLGPPDFLDVVEETGLIVDLGLDVFEQACRQIQRWQVELGDRCPIVHVNLSPREIAAPGHAATLAETLRRSGIAAALVCFEVTEGALMGDPSATAASLQLLRDLGTTVAIDDFGVGHSSLAHLQRFPLDLLKVDRSFVDRLGPNPEDSAIAAAVVRLAHTLGLGAVAEGVETVDQLKRLRHLGCDAAQGFLFSPAVPADEIPALVEGGSLLPVVSRRR